ncbi:MAG: hypothetical protein CMJ83_17260 [Planctomycetes bacterium]|nr:hypothetical protein [Planctomycetota bacterium]
MLRELIHKDLVLNRNALLLNNGLFAVMVTALAHQGIGGQEYGFFSSLFFSFTAITVLVREDKFKARALGCSLPVTARGIVIGRYVLGPAAGGAGALFALSLPLVLPTSSIPGDQILAAETALTCISTITITLALLVPVTIRFGMFGILALLVGLQVLGVAAFALARRFEDVALGPGHAVRWIASALGDAHAALGGLGFSLATLACLAIVSMLSCQASVAIFERRRTG